jgi:hypothetical protein
MSQTTNNIIMEAWNPTQRDEFIDFARNSENHKGHKGPYNFSVFSKSTGNESDDPRKSFVTQVLADTIFNKNPAYRAISLKVYELLIQKIVNHNFLYQFFWNDIVVMLKGGNAYAFMLDENYPEDFNFSDLDIMIYINPYLPSDLFSQIREALSIVVLQTISQYKRTLDHMLFINKPINDSFLSDELIEEFKKDFNEALVASKPFDGTFISPFESDVIRNNVSKNSFVLVNSLVVDDSVVRVEVPHFNKCERIPLRKTPLFASYNTTISFKRDDEQTLDGDFDLYRLRFNCLYNSVDLNDEIKEERITADFIDISIAYQQDAELLDFWNRGKSINFLEKNIGIWIVLPDLDTCINDLNKMINIYDCPDNKKAKREIKYKKMIEIAQKYYENYYTSTS